MFEGLKDFWRAITTCEPDAEVAESEDTKAKEPTTKVENSKPSSGVEQSTINSARAALYVSNNLKNVKEAYLKFFANGETTPELINLIDAAYYQLHNSAPKPVTEPDAKPKKAEASDSEKKPATSTRKSTTSTKKTTTSTRKSTTSTEKAQASATESTSETVLEVPSVVKVCYKIWFLNRQENKMIGVDKIKEQFNNTITLEELEAHKISIIVDVLDENGNKLRKPTDKDYEAAFEYLKKS